MDIDQRLEFLLHSTESLHNTVQEMSGEIHKLTIVAQEHSKQLQIDAENIRSLARIASAHQERLDDLEGKNE